MSNYTFKVLYRTAIWSWAVSAVSSFLPWVRVKSGHAFVFDVTGVKIVEGIAVLFLAVAATVAVVGFKRSRWKWAIYVPPLAGLVVTVIAMYGTILVSLLVGDMPMGDEARVGFGLVILLFAGPLALATSSAMAWEVFKLGETSRDFFAAPKLDTGLPWWRASEAERR